jgi:hypothetical protein
MVRSNQGSNVRVVVGLDFGTSRSGYAYAFVDDGRIVVKTEWRGQPVLYCKTLTQLLYGPDGVEAWGWEALHRLVQLRQRKQAQHYSLLHNFKMALHGERRGAEGPLVTRSDGTEVPVVSVIADYLGLLRESLLADLRTETAGQLQEDEILWCLTVPAIWTDADKAYMRSAAVLAGLVSESEADRERLLPVLEPEAAALHCQEKAKVDLPAGTRFVVVDCGGGTIDITAHVIGSNGDLSELTPGTGGPYGSTYVDGAFLDYVRELWGPECFDWLHTEHPVEFLELLASWERAKCSYEPGTTRGGVFLPLSFKVGSAIEDRFPHVLERMAELQDGYDDVIVLSGERMEGLLRHVLDGLAAKVEELFSRLGARGCDYLFLVGGFSRSPSLQRLIRERFGPRVSREILLPPDPGSAIVEGAVSFGLDPTRIRGRRARLTYGCSMSSPFVHGVDPEEKKIWSPEREAWYCKDRFRVFVSAGDVVEIGRTVTLTYSPWSASDTSFHVDLLATTHREVHYADEPHVLHLGKIEIGIPDTTGGLNRQIEVSMEFGGTEIRVHARDCRSGRKSSATVRFSSTYFPELLGGHA